MNSGRSFSVAAQLTAAVLVAAVYVAGCVRKVSLPVGDAARGSVVMAAADCAGCHTDAKAQGDPLGGGPAMETAFGTFYAPNITPDKLTGIGDWSAEDFQRAMRDGKGKHGEYLYPVFPYASFSGMSDQDIADLWAHLNTVAPSPKASHPHAINAPFNVRLLLVGWRALYFRRGPLKPVAGQSAEWNRGRYLVEAVAHCQECHSPRTALGGIDTKNAFAGNPDGPDGQKAPNITSHPKALGGWSQTELEDMLLDGVKPNGDYLAGGMPLVVAGTSKLSDADRGAMIVYLKTIPARTSTPRKGAAPK
jgi:mono/diheme cytochrome c family protein